MNAPTKHPSKPTAHQLRSGDTAERHSWDFLPLVNAGNRLKGKTNPTGRHMLCSWPPINIFSSPRSAEVGTSCKSNSSFNWCRQELSSFTSQRIIQTNDVRIADIFPICMSQHHRKKNALGKMTGPIRLLIAGGLFGPVSTMQSSFIKGLPSTLYGLEKASEKAVDIIKHVAHIILG